MSLMTYDEARPWAKAIRDQAVARTMPPWGAVKGVGSFQNDPSLTEVEIQMFVAWVEGGAPKGDDDSIAPKLPAQLQYRVKPVAQLSAAGKPAAHKVPTRRRATSQLDHPMTLLGLRPESLDDGQSMLVDAWLPDGRIEHLIWLRDYRKQWTRDYLFRIATKAPRRDYGPREGTADSEGAPALLKDAAPDERSIPAGSAAAGRRGTRSLPGRDECSFEPDTSWRRRALPLLPGPPPPYPRRSPERSCVSPPGVQPARSVTRHCCFFST